MISNKSHRQKFREVSSRYLSPVSAVEPPPSSNHNHHLSPNRQQKPKPSPKHTGFLHGVWPSSTPHSSKSHNENQPAITGAGAGTTLADFLGNDRKKDGLRKHDNACLVKQRSASEFSRFENNPKMKENHKPSFVGGSMRYAGKFRFSGRSSTSSSSSSSSSSSLISPEFLDSKAVIMPGRLSVDENELRRRSYSGMRSDSFSDDSECSDAGRNSPASYMAPTFSSRNMNSPLSISKSPKKSTLKNAMKRANSLASPLKWSSGSPPATMATNSSFWSSKPPTSPSRVKKNLMHMGLDLIKGKRNGSGCLSPLGEGLGMAESVHQLRMMHGNWTQWRYANAKGEDVNETLEKQAKKDLLYTWENIAKLQQSVLQKRLQLEKEKLEMKLNFILRSQMKMLEAWEDMERKHTLDVSMIKDCLHAVVCRVPLIEGAKMNPQITLIALRHTSDLAASIESMLSSFTPMACETVAMLSELAEVAAREKLLLEECFEHFGIVSTLEIQERILRCNIIELTSFNELHHHQHNIYIQA